jgi:hypothetical protein
MVGHAPLRAGPRPLQVHRSFDGQPTAVTDVFTTWYVALGATTSTQCPHGRRCSVRLLCGAQSASAL